MSSTLRHWIYAARMRILPASAIPTIAGIMLAAIDGALSKRKSLTSRRLSPYLG